MTDRSGLKVVRGDADFATWLSSQAAPERSGPAPISFYDTSTVPTQEMLDAICRAPLGDDVYREDPTVSRLEEITAAMLGKEAALFLPSATMSNLIALLVQSNPGDEVVLESGAHMLYAESGGYAAVCGLAPVPVSTACGVMRAADVEPHLRPPNIHYPRTAIVCVENTHNRAGGTVTSPGQMVELGALCRSRRLKLHVDGARIFHAAIALGCNVQDLVADADSVTICLSKGLSAPAGALLAGDGELIREAERKRKMLGGAMRQAGVLAAAGIIALETGIDRLADDHATARLIADRLAGMGLTVLGRVETNIVLIDTAPTGLQANEVVAAMKERGIDALARPPHTIRFVTHRHIGKPQIEHLVQALTEIFGGAARSRPEETSS
jgi:threonine aldolase